MTENELLAMLRTETTATFHIVFLSKTQKSSKWRLLRNDGGVDRDGFRAVIHRQIEESALAAELRIRPCGRWPGPAVSPAAEVVEFVFSANRESCSLFWNRRLLVDRRNVFHCLRALRGWMIGIEAAAGDLDELRPLAGHRLGGVPDPRDFSIRGGNTP